MENNTFVNPSIKLHLQKRNEWIRFEFLNLLLKKEINLAVEGKAKPRGEIGEACEANH